MTASGGSGSAPARKVRARPASVAQDDERGGLDERVVENVLTELQAQNALQGLGLDEDKLRLLAWAVAVNLDYAFELRWAPRWESPRG